MRVLGEESDGGRERSLEEYDALLAAAGLRRIAVITTGSPQGVIEAVAASSPPTGRPAPPRRRAPPRQAAAPTI